MDFVDDIRFRAEYSFSGYLESVLLREKRRLDRAQASPIKRQLRQWWVSLVAFPSYVKGKKRAGECYFHIDRAGLRKRSQQGVHFIGWNEVELVTETDEGLLVEDVDSWMLLPRQAVSPEKMKVLQLALQASIQSASEMSLKAPQVA